MENASKALIMAGSVLLAVLIITALVFTFNQISNLKQVEASSEEEKILAQYNKEIEGFNKSGLYGSEILSLANLIEDYNERQANLKGYEPIALKVTVTEIIGAEILKTTEYTTYTKLTEAFKTIELKVNNLKKEVHYGQTIERLSGMTDLKFDEIMVQNGVSEKEKSKIKELINEYQNLNTEMQTFKNKRFGIPEVKYDNSTGRVLSMQFKEM